MTLSVYIVYMPQNNTSSHLASSLQADSPAVLAKALINAGKALGLSQSMLGQVVGKDRTTLSRGIDPHSKTGELALLLIRCYRSLYVLVGGKQADMKHWMHTTNLHTGGTPAEQIQSVQGLLRVVEYLDAMRGKI
jgi:hypothetical protein